MEKVFFLGKIIEVDFLVELNFLIYPESETNIFSGWFERESVMTSTIEKQVIVGSANLVFLIYLNTDITFYEDQFSSMCTDTYKRIPFSAFQSV